MGHATSMGMNMQGVLDSNYAYVPKGGRLTQKRMQSAGSSARRGLKHRSNSKFAGDKDSATYISAVSDVSGQRLRSLGPSKPNKMQLYNSQQKIPGRQERFNEDVETKSTVSKQKAYNMLSTKNLARFTKGRPSLKVIGTPNLNATKLSQASER